MAKKERQTIRPLSDDNDYFHLGGVVGQGQASAVHRGDTNQPTAFILAGGMSQRMGRDKALLKIHGRTMLQLIRATAVAAGFGVRVIRRDNIKPCGPLSGVLTAFSRSRAPELVFLSCDMPFVTADLLRGLLRQRSEAVFVCSGGRAGFPFKVARGFVPTIERRVKSGSYSIQGLADEPGALRWRPRMAGLSVLTNINTPEEWNRATARIGALQDY